MGHEAVGHEAVACGWGMLWAVGCPRGAHFIPAVALHGSQRDIFAGAVGWEEQHFFVYANTQENGNKLNLES